MSKTPETHQKACAGVRSSSRAVGEESLQAAQLLQQRANNGRHKGGEIG